MPLNAKQSGNPLSGAFDFLKEIFQEFESFENIIEKREFFSINDKLAAELLSAVEGAYLRDIENSPVKRVETNEVLEKLLETKLEEASEIHDGSEEIRLFQLKLSEEIYYYFSFISEELAGRENLVFNKFFAYETGKILGLSRDHPSILKLSGSFIEWIKEKESFVAGWGKISYLSAGDRIILENNNAEDSVEMKIEEIKIGGNSSKINVEERKSKQEKVFHAT